MLFQIGQLQSIASRVAIRLVLCRLLAQASRHSTRGSTQVCCSLLRSELLVRWSQLVSTLLGASPLSVAQNTVLPGQGFWPASWAKYQPKTPSTLLERCATQTADRSRPVSEVVWPPVLLYSPVLAPGPLYQEAYRVPPTRQRRGSLRRVLPVLVAGFSSGS